MVKHATLTLASIAQVALLVSACAGDDSTGDESATGTTTTTTTTTTTSTTDPETTTTTMTTTTTTSTTEPETTTTTGGEAADAFRFTEIYVRDPHFWIVPLIGCQDITDMGPIGQPSINEQFNSAVQGDDQMDGMLDLNFLLLFRPLEQGGDGGFDFATGDCTAPIETTSCDIKDGTSPSSTKYSTMAAGVCLMPVDGELSPADYNPKPGSTNGPCFKGDPLSFTLDLGDFQLPFIDAEVAAQFVGDPADSLVEGVMRGFLTEETADNTLLPEDLPLVGGMPISTLIPGGTGCCAQHDDRDINNGVSGWWFYIEFRAARVPYTGP